MGFFSDLKNEAKQKKAQELLLKKAEKIATKLGRITFYGSGKGSGCNDYEYKGYNLEIRTSARPYGTTRVEVYFDDKEVLSNSIYIEGIWEELLDEIYLSINQTVAERKNQRNLDKRKNEILEQISKYNTDLLFGNGVIAKITKEELNPYSTITDEAYHIYDNGQEVFSAYNHTIFKYIPGEWENTINEYEKNKIEERKKRMEDSALEDIKMLRLKRHK